MDRTEIEEMTEFQADMDAVKGNPAELIPNGDIPTIAPILLLHAKKLFVTGAAASSDDIVRDIKNLDSRVDTKQLKLYLAEHTESEAWIAERNMNLQESYNRMMEDKARITQHVDFVYTRVFDRLRSLTENAVNELADKNIVTLKSLRQATTILKDLHGCERLARNLSTSNVATHTTYGPNFSEKVDQLLTSIEDTSKIIDTQAVALEPL